MRVNLKVPYAEKDQARRLGAKWDRARQTWYIENMEDLTPFMRWMPSHLKKAHEPKLGEVPANWRPPWWA